MKRPWLAMLFAGFLFGSALGQPNSEEDVLFRAANRERHSAGLPALRWNESLANAAQQHASAMARQGTVSHTLPGEPSLPGRATRAGAHYSWISENIVAAGDAEAAHTAFMHSPNHRANILDADMDSVGIAVVERGGQVYVVEDFSKAK